MCQKFDALRIILIMFYSQRGADSSVGTATDYELDGPGIESWWGRDFSHTSRQALGPTPPPVHWGPAFSRGYRRPRRGADHPTPPSAEIENEESYSSTPPLGPGWPVIGWPLPYLFSSQHLADFIRSMYPSSKLCICNCTDSLHRPGSLL
jgi:hypothetical protein